MQIDVDSSYGFVILVICATWFLLNWLEMKTLEARNIYKVPIGLSVLRCSEMEGVQGDFGYVVFVAISSIFMIMWKGFKVGMARKKFEVPYPQMYSDHSDQFNCYQRAHQNTLENYPTFLVLLVFGGLFAPKISALAGIVWIAGRVVYALGYYTGDPEKRLRGAFGYLGLLVLLVNSILFAVRLLGFF